MVSHVSRRIYRPSTNPLLLAVIIESSDEEVASPGNPTAESNQDQIVKVATPSITTTDDINALVFPAGRLIVRPGPLPFPRDQLPLQPEQEKAQIRVELDSNATRIADLRVEQLILTTRLGDLAATAHPERRTTADALGSTSLEELMTTKRRHDLLVRLMELNRLP